MDYNRSNLQIKHTLALSSHLVGMLAWQKVCVQQRMEAAARRVYVCARPHLGIYVFFVCVYACMKALVCVCLDMLNSICIFLAGRKTDSQGSRTGGGGGAAHTCSAQIRLICLGLASHCLPLSTLELPVSLPRVFPSWGGWVLFKMHTEYRTICFFSF